MDNPYIRRYPDASPAASQQPVARKSSLELIHWDDSISNNSINEKASTASDSSSVPPLAQRPLSTISPYIGLGAKLSRAWATHTVVLLLLTAIMFIFNGLEAKEKAQHAIQRLHDGCMNVQTATETVVNLPETMAKGTIKTIEKSTQSLVRMTGKSLISLLDALEKLVVWIIKMYFGTIICIAEVIIRSALDVVADAGKVLTDIANKVINGLIGGLQKAGEGAAKALEGAANGLGGIIGSITGKEAPKIDLLKDIGTKDFSIKIPDEWVNKIKDISAKIPTEDEIFGNLTKVLDKPFGFLKTQISDSFSKVKVNITGKVDFPKKKHIEMCKEGLGKDTINALADVAAKIMYIAAIILIIIAIGIVVSQCLLILRQHRGFQKRLADFRQDLVDYLPVRDAVQRRQQKVTREEMDLFMLPGNSVLNTTTRFINSRFGHSEKVSLWRWYFHYIWHPPSLACFVAGFTGLLCILAQIHAINSLRGTYVPRLARDIDRFDHDYLGGKILGKVHNESAILANKINGGIDGMESDLNHTIFGPVNKGTKGLNDTLDNVVEEYIGMIRKIFKNTPIEKAIEGLVNCTVTKNIRSVQKVLSFVDDHASGIDLPGVGEDILLDPAKVVLKPVNLTINALKKVAVGDFIANAQQLNPKDFLPKKQLKHKNKHQKEKDDDKDDDDDDGKESSHSGDVEIDSDPPETPSTLFTTTSASTISTPAETADDVEFRKRQASTVASFDGEPSESGTSSETTKSTATSTPSATPSKTHSHKDTHKPTPTKEWSREQVEAAQHFQGYTGGIIGELCDSYVKKLKKHIPLMVALMSAWLLIAIGGLVRVFICHLKLKKGKLVH